MAAEFVVERDPSPVLCRELAALAPANPNYTAAYVAARRSIGWEPWVLGLRRDGRLDVGCTAFLKAGRLSRTLEISSLPAIPAESDFWGELLRFCRGQRVSHLQLQSFASTAVTIPPAMGGARRPRQEYILDLGRPGLEEQLSENHRRNIRRARDAGIRMRRVADPAECAGHKRLVDASKQRRAARGDRIPEPVDASMLTALVATGAGELFQAIRDGEVLSSVLVLLAERGGYYQSAGSSDEGLTCGAAHFLVSAIAASLEEASIPTFNLGGAGPGEAGLRRFKGGFGARTVALEAATILVARGLRQFVIRAGSWLLSRLGRA